MNSGWPRILLVDDDDCVLRAFARVCRQRSIALRCTTSPDEALQLMRGGHYAAIITDQVMSGMSGIELLRQARILFPEVARILLTGHASLPMVVDAVNRGSAERVFVKPCDAAHLLDCVEELITERLALIQCALDAIARQSPDDDRVQRTLLIEELPFGWDTLLRRIE